MPKRKGTECRVRLRVFFEDHLLLNNPQLSDSLGRCWILLKPNIATFADLASHLREKFAIRNRLVLSIDDFVLPPFESTCILKDTDIIRVKLKNVKVKDALVPCDGQTNSQGNGNNENGLHDGNVSPGIGVLEQKRELSFELHNSVQQSVGINNTTESVPHIACDSTKEYVQSIATTSKNGQNQFIAMSFKGSSYCSDVSKEESSGFCLENHAWIHRKPKGISPDSKAKTAEQKIDFATLFPLTRSPLRGDILAYRYVEPSSTVYPVLSSPQVGKVSAFDYQSSEIELIPAPEFEVFLEEFPKKPISPQTVSPYKEDGSLEIKLSALIDVRLLKAHNSNELSCLPEGTFNRTKKGKWDMASAKSNWKRSDAHHTDQKCECNSWIPNSNTHIPSWSSDESNVFPRGRGIGGKYNTANERRASASWLHGASPAATLFWETLLSKNDFGSGAKCSSGKY